MTSIAIDNENPLTRWLTSLIIRLPKDIRHPKINRLRIINTYESEYILILKCFWPKEGMQKAEKNNWLEFYQQGGRNEMSTVETATFDQTIIDIHCLTKQPICIHQEDAMSLYYRIIWSHAILSSRKFGIPDNIYRIYSVTHDKMIFKLQLNIISKKDYSSTSKQTLHGVGQGFGNGETHWTFVSIPMMDTVAQITPDFTIPTTQGTSSWKVHMFGFVDDKRHYFNTIINILDNDQKIK